MMLEIMKVLGVEQALHASYHPQSSSRVGKKELNRTLSKLACFMVRQINLTSGILQDILLDMQSYKKAILQNRATIDYLLLQHGIGCSAFAGMCCFNLSDHSTNIRSKMDQLEEMVKHIKQDVDQGWWDWLLGWLPDWGHLRYILGVVLAVVAALIGLCCLIQCIPSLLATCRSITGVYNKVVTGVSPTGTFVNQEVGPLLISGDIKEGDIEKHTALERPNTIPHDDIPLRDLV